MSGEKGTESTATTQSLFFIRDSSSSRQPNNNNDDNNNPFNGDSAVLNPNSRSITLFVNHSMLGPPVTGEVRDFYQRNSFFIIESVGSGSGLCGYIFIFLLSRISILLSEVDLRYDK